MLTYDDIFGDDSYVCDWMDDSDKLKNLDFDIAVLDIKSVQEGAQSNYDEDTLVARVCEHFGASTECVLMAIAFAGVEV